jgi:putative MATE family efflux protein
MKSVLARRKHLIIEAHPIRAILALATPMLIGAILQNVQSLIDLFWVGRLGPEAVAAVSISSTILMLLFPMLMGLATGTVALVARFVGAHNFEEASHAASQSLMLAFVFGGISALIGWHYTDKFFMLLGAESDVLAGGHDYLRITLLGSVTIFILFMGNAALQGVGDTLTPMYIMAVSNVLNIVLDPFFIFGWGPFPEWGVKGAAWASVLAQGVAAGVSVYVLFGGRAHLHVRPKLWIPNLSLSWRILRIGLPGSAQMLTRSLMNAVLMRIVAGLGTAAVAAYGIGMRFHMIVLMPAFALGGAVATIVGQNLGAGKPERARHASWLATALDIVFMVVAAAVMMIFSGELMRLFTQDHEVMQLGSRYLIIVSPFYIMAALGIVLGRALNGAGDSMAPMICTIISLWGVQVPLAIYWAKIWVPAIEGVWWAIAAAMTLHALLIAAWFETGRWQHKKI